MEKILRKLIICIFQLNGKTTLSENIADNGGLKMAYLAFQSWMQKAGKDSFVLPGLDFTPDQLFFIGMGQVKYFHTFYIPPYTHPFNSGIVLWYHICCLCVCQFLTELSACNTLVC